MEVKLLSKRHWKYKELDISLIMLGGEEDEEVEEEVSVEVGVGEVGGFEEAGFEVLVVLEIAMEAGNKSRKEAKNVSTGPSFFISP